MRDAEKTPSGPDFLCSLHRLLAAREERALVQKNLLSSVDGGSLVQIALNVPGWPKRIKNDAAAIRIAAASFKHKTSADEAARIILVNAAGVALLLLFPSLAPRAAKEAGVEVESVREWGRAVDIDVITHAGALSRRDLALPARKCLLCGDDAKHCARERRHDTDELRARVRELLAGVGPG